MNHACFYFALAILLADPALTRAGDLLKNPGFENGPEGWHIKEIEPISSIVPEAARKGSFGLRVNDQSDQYGSGVMSERFPVKPGQKAKVRFWARTTDAKFIGVVLVFFSSDKKWTTDGNEKLPTCALKDVSGKWAKYEFEADIPDYVDATAVWIHSWSGDKGLADFDDFDLDIQ